MNIFIKITKIPFSMQKLKASYLNSKNFYGSYCQIWTDSNKFRQGDLYFFMCFRLIYKKIFTFLFNIFNLKLLKFSSCSTMQALCSKKASASQLQQVTTHQQQDQFCVLYSYTANVILKGGTIYWQQSKDLIFIAQRKKVQYAVKCVGSILVLLIAMLLFK